MLGLELAQRGFAVVAVNIQHEEAGCRAGGDTDIEIGKAPAVIDPLDVSCGVKHAARCGGRLPTWLAGKNVPAPPRLNEGCGVTRAGFWCNNHLVRTLCYGPGNACNASPGPLFKFQFGR